MIPKNSEMCCGSGSPNGTAIMRRWCANSHCGFAEERIPRSRSGFPYFWSERCEANSTTGRAGQELGSRSSSSSIQFSRSLYRGTAQAFAQDQEALALALEGIESGHYTDLETPWEKTFFFLPLGHSEVLKHLEVAIKLAKELVEQAPAELCRVLEHSAAQARGHRDVIARFGRHPHRNAVLGRQSTPEELAYWPAANSYIRVRCHSSNRESCRSTVFVRHQAAPPPGGDAVQRRVGRQNGGET